MLGFDALGRLALGQYSDQTFSFLAGMITTRATGRVTQTTAANLVCSISSRTSARAQGGVNLPSRMSFQTTSKGPGGATIYGRIANMLKSPTRIRAQRMASSPRLPLYLTSPSVSLWSGEE